MLADPSIDLAPLPNASSASLCRHRVDSAFLVPECKRVRHGGMHTNGYAGIKDRKIPRIGGFVTSLDDLEVTDPQPDNESVPRVGVTVMGS